MTKDCYPIYADDGSKFCMRKQGANGEPVIEGPKGKTVTVTNFMAQLYNPSTANSRRGKIK
jgi:hypothetical protein